VDILVRPNVPYKDEICCMYSIQIKIAIVIVVPNRKQMLALRKLVGMTIVGNRQE